MQTTARSMAVAMLACTLATPVFAAAREETRTYRLYDGSTAEIGRDGIGWLTSADGKSRKPLFISMPGGRFNDFAIIKQLSLPRHGPASGRVLVTVAPGARPPAGARPLPGATGTFVVDVRDDPSHAARRLAASPGVVHAAPDWYVSSMALDPVAVPQASRPLPAAPSLTASPALLPSNYGLQSSLQAHLNAGGVNAVAAFAQIARRFGQLPGQGMRITNVSIGDLTDQAMADGGDFWVQFFGPTTIVQGGQRYLDVPSMPLIPTFVVAPDGSVDPLGTVEGVDPFLGEVLLDFSVMAPLPHDRQRASATGAGTTDLLGIAPGADYRLVVPAEPAISNIYVALLAAAQQTPRPDVITASLGFGFDGFGFPGRYLEEDPAGQQIIDTIVHQYGIVVCISANDGTRLFTPAAIGPDGGSAPTLLADAAHPATDVNDVAFSTAPSFVKDSGAIDVGGTTLDDVTLAPPWWGGPLARNAVFPTTRLDGSGGFSSGFGSRVNVSAPSDGIVALLHSCDGSGPCTAQSVIPVLNGGTSASAPMTAAAAAVVLQVARLTGRHLSATQVRDLLVATGRPLQDAPQSDGPVNVGASLDLAAAVQSLLPGGGTPAIARLAVAHRRPLDSAGLVFVENTDPAAIDLQGPTPAFSSDGSGQNATGPITFAADVLDTPRDGTTYAVVINGRSVVSGSPAIRILPSEIAAMAGIPFAATAPRQVSVRYEVRRAGAAVTSVDQTLVLGPTDGTWTDPLAPIAPAVVTAGGKVTVQYDLTSVRGLNAPSLLVSSVDHFSPFSAPIFRAETTVKLTSLAGKIILPASAFKAGAGVYGIGIQPDAGDPFRLGALAMVRIAPAAPGRAAPPLLSGGHSVTLSRSAAGFGVQWDVSSVAGADGAMLEISPPGPNLRNSYNTFTNQNGNRRDDNGVETPSAVWMPLGAVRGSRTFDALALGLHTSLFYSARVIATRAGAPVGEASAVSGLELDDGFVPGTNSIMDFDVSADGKLVSLFDYGDPVGASAVVRYSSGTGTYGPAIVADPLANVMYRTVGTDPALHSTLIMGQPWNDWQQNLLTFDSRSGAALGRYAFDFSPSAPPVPLLSAGRVDPVRHRAVLLGGDWSTGDLVFPFDMGAASSTSPLGSPVNADGSSGLAGIYNAIDVDASTGRVFLASALLGDICVIFQQHVGSVDLDGGAVQGPVPDERCNTGLAASQDGSSFFLTKGPLFSFPSLLPVADVQGVSETSMQPGGIRPLHARSPFFPAVEPAHHLLFVAFVATDDVYTNNNAMSAVGAFDLSTGERMFFSPNFNFAWTALSGGVQYLQAVRGIQFDPSTRTAWTFGPGAQQLQQFSY